MDKIVIKLKTIKYKKDFFYSLFFYIIKLYLYFIFKDIFRFYIIS